MFETPILFIIFNRCETAQEAFEVIRRIQPRYLFISADGPRDDRPIDIELCNDTRAAILQMIDWPCVLKTLFRSTNRGCGRGPAEAITWFFDQVEEGIVLEDDCVPDISFFPYCQALLAKYRYNDKIYMITGTNALQRWLVHKRSYFFSYMGHSLGWASWRRAWSAFDYNMGEWMSNAGKQKIKITLSSPLYFNHFSREFSKYHLNSPNDVWDFQWLFARWVNGGKTIVPSVNLITNIGFNADATHSFNETDLLANLPKYKIKFPLIHSNHKVDKFFDWYVFERFINNKPRPFWKKVLLKLLKIFIINRRRSM